MTTAMTASDVFKMAIGMEQIGRDFYEALALGSEDAKVRDFCLRTARDESKHLDTFQQMHKEWTKRAGIGQTTMEKAAALASLAKAHIQPDPEAVHKVAIGGSLKDALNMAIQMEQDSIRFYQGLIAHLPESAQVIQGIVEQEKKHLSNLQFLVG